MEAHANPESSSESDGTSEDLQPPSLEEKVYDLCERWSLKGRPEKASYWADRSDVRFAWAKSVREFRRWKKQKEEDARPDVLDLMPSAPNRNKAIFAEPLFIVMRDAYRTMLDKGHTPTLNTHKAIVTLPTKRKVRNAIDAGSSASDEDSSDDSSSADSSSEEDLPTPAARKRGRTSKSKTPQQEPRSKLSKLALAKPAARLRSPCEPLSFPKFTRHSAATPTTSPPFSASKTHHRAQETPSFKPAHKKTKMADDSEVENEAPQGLRGSVRKDLFKHLMDSEFARLKESFDQQVQSSVQMVLDLCGLR